MKKKNQKRLFMLCSIICNLPSNWVHKPQKIYFDCKNLKISLKEPGSKSEKGNKFLTSVTQLQT